MDGIISNFGVGLTFHVSRSKELQTAPAIIAANHTKMGFDIRNQMKMPPTCFEGFSGQVGRLSSLIL